jgi:hypothetical protein
MKINLRLYITMLISVYLLSATSFAQSQDNEITFAIAKKGEKFFSIDSQGQKSIDVTITGISTQTEMDAFIVKFKAIEGVVKFDVAPTLTAGTWTATVTFTERADKKYLAATIVSAGVKKVIIAGETINAEEVGNYSKKGKE